MSSKTEFARERAEDVVSEFPDEILCNILSFIPSSEAVRAGTLSTRWRNLWASVAALDIEDTFLSRIKGKNKRKQQDMEKGFLNYVQKMINRENISGSLTLRLCCSIFPANVVSRWVIAAIKHNVKHLDLCFLGDRMELPAILFQSTSLEVLKLKGNHLGICDSVWLPSLKVFHLDFKEFGNYADLDVFLSNFRALEELCIKRYVVVMKKLVFNISLPKLKRLQMEFVDGNVGEPYQLVIDAPNLEYLHLKDYQTKFFEVTNLGSLVEACVDWKPKYFGSETNDDCCGQIAELIKGVTSVKSLSLSSQTILFLTNALGFDVPIFNYLKHLELDIAGDFGCRFLARFLPCVPELETLVLINKGDDIEVRYWDDWSPPDRVPECLSSPLREIVVRGLCEEYEFEAMKYLLEHSQVLNKVTVECGYEYDASDEEIEDFFKELLSFPRASATCEITMVSKD